MSEKRVWWNSVIFVTIIFIVSIVFGFSSVGLALAQDKPAQVVIGYQPFPTAEMIVKDQKLNEKTFGVPVKWVPASSGMQAHQALKRRDPGFCPVGVQPGSRRSGGGNSDTCDLDS